MKVEESFYASFLHLGSYIHLDKTRGEYTNDLYRHHTKLKFDNNFAQNGGALYIVNDVVCNGGSTSRNTELTNTIMQCFLQTHAFYPYVEKDVNIIIYISISFSNNTANKSGGDIYGGLLDRCTPSPLTELKINPNVTFNNMTGLDLIENIARFDWEMNNILPIQAYTVKAYFFDSRTTMCLF